MGRRVYVAKKWEVEWGGYTDFNYLASEFIRLINILTDDNIDIYSEDFEVDKDDWNRAIEILSKYKEGANDSIDYALGDLSMTAEEVAESMRKYLKESDPSNGYLHFTVW